MKMPIPFFIHARFFLREMIVQGKSMKMLLMFREEVHAWNIGRIPKNEQKMEMNKK